MVVLLVLSTCQLFSTHGNSNPWVPPGQYTFSLSSSDVGPFFKLFEEEGGGEEEEEKSNSIYSTL